MADLNIDVNLIPLAITLHSALAAWLVNPGDSIQNTIDAAQEGDVIVVSVGTYYENINPTGKNVTLMSENPDDEDCIDATIIDGGANGTVITFINGETTDFILDGFTIQNGSGNIDWNGGGGILIESANPQIKHFKIKNCNVDFDGWGWGSAIFLSGNCSPNFEDGIIENNNGIYGIISIWLYGDYHIINFTRCIVRNNTNTDSHQADYESSSILECYGDDWYNIVNFIDCEINNNIVINGGNGVSFRIRETGYQNVYNFIRTKIINNEIFGDEIIKCEGGGGRLVLWGDAECIVNFINCNISKNNLFTESLPSIGGGLYAKIIQTHYKSYNSAIYCSQLFLLIAVGYNKISTSDDGISWSDILVNNYLYCVIWCTFLNKLIAVGNNCIYTSTNGTDWILGTIPNGNWKSITQSSNLLVAVSINSSGNQIVTSPDGITWTVRSAPLSAWDCITWSSALNLFVAVGHLKCMSSSNGITWVRRYPPYTLYLKSVIFAQSINKFVIAASYGRILTSPDGISWTLQTTGIETNYAVLNNIAELTNKIIACGYGTIIISEDAILWNKQTCPSYSDPEGFYGISYPNLISSIYLQLFDKYVIVAASGPYTSLLSLDLINWTGYYDNITNTINITNSTIANNIIKDDYYSHGGGIYLKKYLNLNIKNSIIFNNIKNGIEREDENNIIITYSNIQDIWFIIPEIYGEGNISLDPIFVDPDNNDFNLQRLSPCIDTGTSSGAPANDLWGKTRPFDGDGDSIADYDMGCYEFSYCDIDINALTIAIQQYQAYAQQIQSIDVNALNIALQQYQAYAQIQPIDVNALTIALQQYAAYVPLKSANVNTLTLALQQYQAVTGLIVDVNPLAIQLAIAVVSIYLNIIGTMDIDFSSKQPSVTVSVKKPIITASCKQPTITVSSKQPSVTVSAKKPTITFTGNPS